MVTLSCRLLTVISYYWKLLPEYTTCLGWMTALVPPTSPKENRNQESLKPTEQVIVKPCTFLILLKYLVNF